jgi:hypothetical protein
MDAGESKVMVMDINTIDSIRFNAARLRIALSVISGRRTDLSPNELITLGFDPYKIGYGPYDESTLNVIRERAEEILFTAIEDLSKQDNEVKKYASFSS